jgi:hypothetical protein
MVGPGFRRDCEIDGDVVAVEHPLRDADAAPSADAIPPRLRRGGGSARQVFALVLIGTLVLAVFASHDLSTWLDRLGDGRLLLPLQQAAAEWDGAMTRLGLAGPAEALRLAVRRLLDWEWGARS